MHNRITDPNFDLPLIFTNTLLRLSIEFDYRDPVPEYISEKKFLVTSAIVQGTEIFIEKHKGNLWILEVIEAFMKSENPYYQCIARMYHILSSYKAEHYIQTLLGVQFFLLYLEEGPSVDDKIFCDELKKLFVHIKTEVRKQETVPLN